MGFNIENHALMAERGFYSFSIPSNTPPISHSATPPSQPILHPHDVVVTDRPTLQPVPSSQRAIPKSCRETTTENVNYANEFLSRELAQIIEEWQRRELAWNPRIMDIEKDEAMEIRDYLCKAISKYAVSEAPPLLLSFSRTLDQFLAGQKAWIMTKQTKLALQSQLRRLGSLGSLSNCLANW